MSTVKILIQLWISLFCVHHSLCIQSEKTASANQDLAGLSGPYSEFWNEVANLQTSAVQTKNQVLSSLQLKSLQEYITDLENDSDESRNWRTDRKYLVELVDPMKYCFVQGVTKSTVNVSSSLTTDDPNSSKKFQLLPTDVIARPLSNGVRIKSYINNLHPTKYNKLYSSISKVISASRPLFEQVLTKLHNKNQTEVGNVQLSGRNLQFVVGIKEILLPPNSTYGGSNWHKEGLKNEHIIASAVYYIDVQNVNDSKLAFRAQLDAQREKYADFEPAVAETNKMVVFPNIYEHKVLPFSPSDPNKPGIRKIITLFLIDPSIRIISTSNVKPQQSSWKNTQEGGEHNDILGPRSGCCSMTPEKARGFYNEAIEERKDRPITIVGKRTARHCNFD